MSQKVKRTLVDSPAPRRSPRISTKDVEERSKSLKATPKTKRIPTPPRAKKINLVVPKNDGKFGFLPKHGSKCSLSKCGIFLHALFCNLNNTYILNLLQNFRKTK